MKQLLLSLVIVLMSMMTSTPVSAKSNKKSVKDQVPTNIVVKQTTHFNDGRTLTIYYKKSGMLESFLNIFKKGGAQFT